ncbi:MAG: hypothetical protein JO118_14170 [Acetobacteraceae bacterium]|nr:hypothetical protein [Acetobacteraceae bacterium]
MLEYARLSPGPGFRPGRAALYFSQRLLPYPGLRRLVSRAIAAGVNLRHRAAGSPDTPAAPQGVTGQEPGVLAALARDGFALTDPLLTAPMLAESVAFLRGQEAIGPDRRRFRVEDRPAGTTMASYPLETVLGCPHVLALASDPRVLRVVTAYLGCRPTLSSIGIRWSFPAAGERAAGVQRFHRDPDDWRFLKLFVYLTDVDAGSGPHEFVAGSHRTAGRVLERPYAMEEIEPRYGPQSVRRIEGPRGTSFFADTYGIHRGAVPTTGARLILQLQYSLLPVFAFLYRPVPAATVPGLGIDRYVSRLLVA